MLGKLQPGFARQGMSEPQLAELPEAGSGLAVVFPGFQQEQGSSSPAYETGASPFAFPFGQQQVNRIHRYPADFFYAASEALSFGMLTF